MESVRLCHGASRARGRRSDVPTRQGGECMWCAVGRLVRRVASGKGQTATGQFHELFMHRLAHSFKHTFTDMFVIARKLSSLGERSLARYLHFSRGTVPWLNRCQRIDSRNKTAMLAKSNGSQVHIRNNR